jgi:AraC-like DNA-binding protein
LALTSPATAHEPVRRARFDRLASEGDEQHARQLDAAAGVSRAAFARYFNELVREPPMTFHSGRRIALAADLLREPGATAARSPTRSVAAVRSR